MYRPAIFLAAATLPAAAALAQQSAEPARTVQFELREGDVVIAAPALRIELGRPAAVSVGNYSLRLRMMRAGDGAPYVIRSSLYRAQGGWTLVAAPTLTVADGGQAQVTLDQGAEPALTLAVSVR